MKKYLKFSERYKLAEACKAWCRDRDLPETALNVITALNDIDHESILAEGTTHS